VRKSSLFLFLMFSGALVDAQPRVKDKAEVLIEDVRRQSVVSIRLTVKITSDSKLFVPFCGELNGGPELCDLAVTVEALSKRRWRSAIAACGSALPGGFPLTKSLELTPGKSQLFVYEFAADYFKLTRGQRLRLRLDVWPDESSVAHTAERREIYSSQFSLP